MRAALLAGLIVACLSSSLACCLPAAKQDPPAPAQPQQAPPEVQEWTDASKGSATIGDLSVKVSGARVGKAKIRRFSAQSEAPSDQDALIIHLELTNLSEVKKIEHAGWSLWSYIGARQPKLTDNFGNSYTWRAGGNALDAHDGIKLSTGSIYPGKAAPDIVQFEVPVEKAKYLRLELPLPLRKTEEPQVTFRFEIPVGMVVMAAKK